MTANKEKKRDKVFRLLEKSLGTDTDKSIAKKVGCSASYVGKLRKYDFWKKEPLQKIAVYTTEQLAGVDADYAYELTKSGKPPKEGTYTRSSVLDTAKQYVTKDRDATHGNMEDNFREIAELWTQYTEHTLHPSDVAVMMALLKIARLKSNKDNPDNWVDACGYLACGGELVAKK